MCIRDSSYPSMPLFLLYNPRLVEAMMRPIFRYARSDAWPYPFAPHDAGYYPLLNGQTYGMEMERQMPVEDVYKRQGQEYGLLAAHYYETPIPRNILSLCGSSTNL